MSTAIALGFAIGVFAALASSGLPFAVAALGLSAASANARRSVLAPALGLAARRGATAAIAFLAVFAVAFALEEASLEVSDLVPVPALVLAALVVALAVRLAGSGWRAAASPNRVAVLFGIGYAIVSLPGGLWLLQGLVEQTSTARGNAGAIGSCFLFAAGVFAVLIALAVVAELLTAAARRAGEPGRVLGALVAAAAAFIAALYWAPAITGGIEERGGWVADAVGEASGAVGVAAAQFLIVPALILLAAAVAALVFELRRER